MLAKNIGLKIVKENNELQMRLMQMGKSAPGMWKDNKGTTLNTVMRQWTNK